MLQLISINECLTQQFVPSQYKFNPSEVKITDEQLESFLSRGIIEKAVHSKGEYISSIFIRPKKDESYHLILNLKQLNEAVEYHHFKMENLKNAIRYLHILSDTFTSSLLAKRLIDK